MAIFKASKKNTEEGKIVEPIVEEKIDNANKEATKPRIATEEVKPAIKENEEHLEEEIETSEIDLNDIKVKILVEGLDFSAQNVSDLLDKIVLNAQISGSSDVHIEPREKDVIVRYRIDGMLREILEVNKQTEESLIFRIKIAAKLRTDEHFAPQDGKIRFEFSDRRLDTRISVLPTTKGEKVVIRLLSQEGKSFKLQDLGLTGDGLIAVEKNYLKPYGMILSTGPTGSGKTTTLYSILQIINSRDKNITTVEDPVEYDIDGVNHVQINTKANLTFSNVLRSILRQDPDVVMVGEIRDSETAKIAINAAMTGHLVLSTLHTNDSVTAIPRLIDMGVERYLVATTVNVVIAQRLARKLCVHCKKKYVLSDKEYKSLKSVRPDIATLVKTGEKLYKEVGCVECVDTGYKGRVGFYEVLELKENLRKIIAEGATADAIRVEARKQGLVLIVEDGVNKLKGGEISLNELLRVTAILE